MPSSKKVSRKKTFKGKNRISFKEKGFSGFFVLVVVAMAVFLAGAFQATQTFSPVQGVPNPSNPFSNPNDKKTLQLRTLNFVSITPGLTNQAQPPLCTQGGANDEPEILVGYSPASGQTVSAGGQIKVWINDEHAPFIAPGEIVNATTGQITTPGNRNAKARDNYLLEPALYIAPQTAETGGAPHFPIMIKGDYNNTTTNGSGTHVAGMDPVPPGKRLTEPFTAEDIWDVNSLGLSPGTYTAEFVIHDGDDNRGVGCVTITIQ